MPESKEPINWWRVIALAATPLFLYSTWNYGEAQARFNHLSEHYEELNARTNGANDAEGSDAPASASEPTNSVPLSDLEAGETDAAPEAPDRIP